MYKQKHYLGSTFCSRTECERVFLQYWCKKITTNLNQFGWWWCYHTWALSLYHISRSQMQLYNSFYFWYLPFLTLKRVWSVCDVIWLSLSQVSKRIVFLLLLNQKMGLYPKHSIVQLWFHLLQSRNMLKQVTCSGILVYEGMFKLKNLAIFFEEGLPFTLSFNLSMY